MIIRIAGFGGQGVVMAGYILGQAGILEGGNAMQTQSYGSESRGGACRSDVIISDGEILELAPSDLDVLVAMSQPAWDKFGAFLRDDGILIFDSDLVDPGERDGRNVGLPATAMAQKLFGQGVITNVMLLGCLVGYTEVVTRNSFVQAMSDSVPSKTVEMNLEAFEAGFDFGAKRK